jgi:hypothetical protein
MPRKPNYQFEKRQKELDRKARKEEKLRRRQERATDADAPGPAGAGQTPDGTDASDGARGTPASDR